MAFAKLLPKSTSVESRNSSLTAFQFQARLPRVNDKLKFVGHLSICRIYPALWAEHWRVFLSSTLRSNRAQTLLFGHRPRNALF
jgi:hypothetical protein